MAESETSTAGLVKEGTQQPTQTDAILSRGKDTSNTQDTQSSKGEKSPVGEQKQTKKPKVLIVGTGEYVTGVVHGSSSTSDKRIGVVALVCFDLRRRGYIGDIILAGTNGSKFPGIREHFKKEITEFYKDMDTTFHSFPKDNETDSKAYLKAMDTLEKGDLVMIFTPDDLHFQICKDAIVRGLHVLVTKPIVKELKQHLELMNLASQHNSLVAIEVHKRWDAIYADARERCRSYGNFNYFQSYMSQPKSQLNTFKAWAGKSSDISYYLNSHHVDFHSWILQDKARVERVVAMSSYGISKSQPYDIDTEDTITLMAHWKHIDEPKATGVAVYTASWVAPKADVHSQQSFHYMGATGEVRVDQAHRGYSLNTDTNAHQCVNPLYMKYTPDTFGFFSGQQGYGYRSIEDFVKAGISLKEGTVKDPQQFNASLATVWSTLDSTAIIEAGRLSLDNSGKSVMIEYEKDIPSKLVIV